MLMGWLGHTDAKMIKLYYHAQKDELRRQMVRLKLQASNPGGAAAG